MRLGEGRKIAWVAWDKVSMSREEGGLSIKDLRLFNEVLFVRIREM